MQQSPPPLAQIIIRYDAPLQRYARRLVKDQAAAAAIVKVAFEHVYDINGFNADNATLRRLFKSHTYKIATGWLLAQSRPKHQNN